MHQRNLGNCLSFARVVAWTAGEMLISYRAKALQRIYTSRTHFRTEADEVIDGMACAAIRERFPGHAIHSEESGDSPKKTPWKWIVDSVDGTINLWSGFTDHAAFCISLNNHDVPVVGVVNAALRGECYTAMDGGGAFCNDKPIKVSDVADLGQVLMGIDSGKHDRTANLPYIEKAHGPGGITCAMSTGCASVPLALVASGVLHAYLATSLEPEDMAASAILIREAGGVVTNLRGERWTAKDASILAANPALHAKLLDFFGA